MSTSTKPIQDLTEQEYKYGFVTDIEAETIPGGLNEEIIHLISEKKHEPEFMLEWRLKAYRHWLTMKEPTWHNVHYPPIDYQAIFYYSAPKMKKAPNSLEEVDPELLKTYEKLGIPLAEQKLLAGVAANSAFHYASVATPLKKKTGGGGNMFLLFAHGPRRKPGRGPQYLFCQG